MTALKQYDRLETIALWRPGADQQRREVTIFFGDATLVIADGAGRPLAHWSLAALERLNPGIRPALYAPDTEVSEDLEIEDAIVIDAIEKVRKTIRRAQPRPGRLRSVSIAASLAAIVALGVFWAPGALRRESLAVVPVSKRQEIGTALLAQIQRLTGPLCQSAVATEALSRLRLRILGPESRARLFVVPAGIRTVRAMPGGILLINRALVEHNEDPAVLAGYILAAVEQAQRNDPLRDLLENVGLMATVTLLTSGDLPAEALRSYADTFVAQQPSAPDSDWLLALFDTARVATEPYAFAVDPTGETTLDLIEASPVSAKDAPPVLSDRDWVALQGICAN